ncbi:hypothetical protein TSAR_009223 [Trichomalopsis sarcophagae]|uniref:EF-hand domain-containing protein n=1 Tax=Trichomalopsis sarcophagae TaxID=543379 RepID=A0A232ESL6_9HYME|nr:hypothetical protein TSAR_009223 [Trichomalopsis sarcophagae]
MLLGPGVGRRLFLCDLVWLVAAWSVLESGHHFGCHVGVDLVTAVARMSGIEHCGLGQHNEELTPTIHEDDTMGSAALFCFSNRLSSGGSVDITIKEKSSDFNDLKSTCLAETSNELKMAFDAFDHEKRGCISTDMVGTILVMLGHELSDETLRQIIAEVDVDGLLTIKH